VIVGIGGLAAARGEAAFTSASTSSRLVQSIARKASVCFVVSQTSRFVKTRRFVVRELRLEAEAEHREERHGFLQVADRQIHEELSRTPFTHDVAFLQCGSSERRA
jgi:hypothetical protein